MSSETTESGDSGDKNPFRRELRRWRWPLVGLAVVLVFLTVVYVAVPLVIRYVATGELEAMGARDVEIGEVEFDPFDGAATMSDLVVTGRDGDRLAADRLTIFVDFGDLFARRIHLPEVALEGALLDVRRLETGGILFAGLAPMADEDVEEGEEDGWQFGFDKLEIARSRLRYTETDFETTLVLDDLSFGRVLAWQPDEASDFRFSGALGDSNLSAEGTAMPFASVNRGDIQLDLSALDLSAFETVLRDAGLPQLDGVVEARIALTTALSASKPPKIAVEGRIAASAPSLTLESGVLSGKRIVWTGRIAYDGALEDYLALDGSLEGEGLRLPVADGPADVGTLTWDGKIALAEPADDVVVVKLDGTAGLENVAVEGDVAQKVTVRSVRLHDLASVLTLGSDGGIGFDQTGRIEVDGLALKDSDRAVEIEVLSWNGKVVQSHDGSSLSMQGAFGADTITVRAEQAGETASVEKVVLAKSALEIKRAGDSIDIVHEGPLVVTGSQLDSPQATAREGKVEWSGRLSARLENDGSTKGDLDGSLRTEDAVIRLVTPALALEYKSLVFEGTTSIAGTAVGAMTSRTAGRTAIEKLSLTDEGRALMIIAVEKLAVEGVQGTEQGLAQANSLEASDIRIGVPLPEATIEFVHKPMHIAQVRVDGVGAFNEAAMQLGDVTVTDLSLTAVRDKEGTIQLPIVITAAPAAANSNAARPSGKAATSAATAGQATVQPSDQEPEGASGATVVAIKSLTVGGESTLSFLDLSTEPNFQQTLDKFSLALNGLDGAQPDTSAKLDISGAIGEFSTVEANGTVSPFADPASTDMKIALENINLPPLSVYSAKYLGYRLDTGELDATIDLKVSGTDLMVESDLDIRQLTLDLEQDSQLEALRKELGIPIETGLNLLRNSDGDIRLEVPVSGELGNPQFDFSDAINQAVGSAMKSAVLTILFPLGAVIAASESSGGGNIKLDPVTFVPGTVEFAGAGKELLAKTAEFLGGREGIVMRLCGYAVPSDAEALAAQASGDAGGPAAVESEDEGAEQPATAEAAPGTGDSAVDSVSETSLDNLASERAIRVKAALVDEYGIDPKRLLLCRPRVDAGAAKPRVEILL